MPPQIIKGRGKEKYSSNEDKENKEEVQGKIKEIMVFKPQERKG